MIASASASANVFLVLGDVDPSAAIDYLCDAARSDPDAAAAMLSRAYLEMMRAVLAAARMREPQAISLVERKLGLRAEGTGRGDA